MRAWAIRKSSRSKYFLIRSEAVGIGCRWQLPGSGRPQEKEGVDLIAPCCMLHVTSQHTVFHIVFVVKPKINTNPNTYFNDMRGCSL
jgi:hypothetical protein